MNEEYLEIDSNRIPTTQKGNSSLENIRLISDSVAQNKDVVNKALDLTAKFADVYAESQRLNAQVEITKEMSKVELARISSTFLNTRLLIQETFKERRFGLDAYYQALEKGLAENNQEMIISAMTQIGQVVTSSPLEDIKEFAKAVANKDKTILDF